MLQVLRSVPSQASLDLPRPLPLTTGWRRVIVIQFGVALAVGLIDQGLPGDACHPFVVRLDPLWWFPARFHLLDDRPVVVLKADDNR